MTIFIRYGTFALIMKDSTEKIYHEKANRVIDYIHTHLHEPLALDTIASAMCLSLRQMQRIIETELHQSLSEYITRQRLEQAILYMQLGNYRLEEVAQKTGYGNAQAFSKAFKKYFGIAPKTYLQNLQKHLSQFTQTTHHKSNELPSEIIDFEGLNLVYIRIRGQYGAPEAFYDSWAKLIDFLNKNEAIDPNTRYIGLSFDDPNTTSFEHCFFYACASVHTEVLPSGFFGTIHLPPGKYVVYTLNGSYSDLQPFYNQIMANFKYDIRYGMPFEEYIGYSHDAPFSTLTKIFIPIK